MTESAQQAAPQQAQGQSAPAESSGGGDTFEQRLAALHTELRAASPEAAGEAADGSPQPPAEASPVASDDAAQRAEARRARLAELAARERRNVDISTKLAERDRLARELEQERQTRAQLEARTKELIDISKLDEASFFDLAQRANVPPQKLGEWLRDAMTNPERLASTVAKKALDPELEAIRRENAEMREQLQSFISAQRQAEAEAQERAVEQQFLGSIQAESAPHAHTFLSKFGPEEFLKIARSAGRTLPPGAGAQALIDTIEEHLESFASAFGASPQTQSNGLAPTPHRPAAAKAPNTLSNAMARERASVVDESSFDDLPYEERLARIKRGFAA
jgi:hypothetical protein